MKFMSFPACVCDEVVAINLVLVAHTGRGFSRRHTPRQARFFDIRARLYDFGERMLGLIVQHWIANGDPAHTFRLVGRCLPFEAAKPILATFYAFVIKGLLSQQCLLATYFHVPLRVARLQGC